MADEPITPPVPATGTPGTPPPAIGTSPSSTGATPTKTLEELQARIAELERHSTNKEQEAARHGKNLTTAEKKLAEYEEKDRLAQEATLSEIEKSKKRVAEIEAAKAASDAQIQQYKTQLIVAQVRLAAQAKGIIDPELAAMAIQDKLEMGEDGMPTNTDKALDDLIKNKPYLAPAKPVEQPINPAQTANNQRPPATPAMNPGRSAISPSTQAVPGQIVKLNDMFRRQS